MIAPLVVATLLLAALSLLVALLLTRPFQRRLARAWSAQLAHEATSQPSIPMPSHLPVECIYCGPPKGGPSIRTICSDCRPRSQSF
mgnify:CR=1 FL=1